MALSMPPEPRKQLSTCRFRKGPLLGQGSFGRVYECFEVETGQTRAMKEIVLSAKTLERARAELRSIKNEISLLRRLQHPNIIKYYQFQIDDASKAVEIIMEKASEGNLYALLKKAVKFDEATASFFCRQLLQALAYVHGQGIIHRDIKAANCLVDEGSRLILTDFGTAKDITQRGEDKITENKSLKGTPFWMAPEVLNKSGHNSSADIWSTGCFVLELLTGKPPHFDPTLAYEEVLKKIRDKERPKYPSLSKEARRFLDSCL